MAYHCRLSICMMVKNEEKNLKRCLESLYPVINKPYVELIIVDTGSEDKTVEVAKKYTDKVYFHKWNNHFSEMRNITISYAKGDWIFVIDADEELENPEEVIELFETKKIDKYNTITIKMKNLVTKKEGNIKYGVNVLERIFKNDEEFHYKGSVHNQPISKGPVLASDISLIHYGYIKDNKDLVKKKFNRTATLLKNELEKNPKNIYYQYQLAVSYGNIDTKQALIEIKKAYNLMKKLPFREQRKYGYIYGMYAKMAYTNKKFLEVIKICKEGIEFIPGYVDLYYILANSYMDVKNYKLGVETFQKYLEIVNEYNKYSISKNPSFTIYHLDSHSKSIAFYQIAKYYYEQGEHRKAFTYIEKIEKCSQKVLLLKIILMIKISLEHSEYDVLKKYYDDIKKDKETSRTFINYLEAEKEKLTNEERNKLEEIFSHGDDIYAILNKIRISEGYIQSVLVEDVLDNIDFNSLPVFYSEIFKYAIKDFRKVVNAFRRLTNNTLKQYINFMINKYEDIELKLIDYLKNANMENNDLQSSRIHMCIANVLLLNEVHNAKFQKREIDDIYFKIFNSYIEKGIGYLSRLYQISKMRLYYRTLDNSEEQFLIIIHFAEEALNKEKYEIALRYFRQAIKVYPHFAIYMNRYIEKVFRDVK